MEKSPALHQRVDNALFTFAFGAFTLAIVLAFYREIILATLLLAIVSATGLYWWRSRTTTAIFFLGGIACAVSEMLAIFAGAWSYTYSNFWGVPVWIFLVWANASAFVYQSAIELKKRLGFAD